jgi:hypothetical protein
MIVRIMAIRKTFRFLLLACGAVLLSGTVPAASAQNWLGGSNPCQTGPNWPADLTGAWSVLRADPFSWLIRPIETQGLTPAAWGLIVYDSNQGGRYLEVWSHDVVSYPISFSTAKSDGYFPAN